jgi:hypothetical protein
MSVSLRGQHRRRGMGGAVSFYRPAGQQQNQNETEHNLFLFGEEVHASIIPYSPEFPRKIQRGKKTGRAGEVEQGGLN